jgi:hypothetical protein
VCNGLTLSLIDGAASGGFGKVNRRSSDVMHDIVRNTRGSVALTEQ